ncbi:hypothetical protein [Rhodococcus sp. IEGM 1409]|uniref:hypothetical protein n=1 Tax=Rhodococcus sp. IEGM 1409 TaxID=3047082 RepID=UPI0032D57CEC
MTDAADFTRAVAIAGRLTMESLLSPVLAAVALSFMTFNLLFVAASVGFAVSTLLVPATRIPNACNSTHRKAWDRIASGVRIFVTTPRLRGIMALNLVVAAAGAIVVVNTVNYVRDELGGTQSDVAWMLAASGTGTLLTALLLPRVIFDWFGGTSIRCATAVPVRRTRHLDRRPCLLLRWIQKAIPSCSRKRPAARPTAHTLFGSAAA